jgi:hypothetical protein
MKTIETNIQVSGDRKLHLTLPLVEELQPGVYHVVMVIDEQLIQPVAEAKKKPLKLNVFKWEGWPADCTFRREDIYEDDGR